MHDDYYFAMLERRLELTRTLARYERELEVAARELAQHRFQLQVMKNSLPWRMTAPLRYFAGLVNKWGISRAGRELAALRSSELFDPVWYLTRYPDVALRGMDPGRHYLQYGADEGRNPGPGFDTNWYRESNPDVASSGINPLIHYILHGRAEQRLPKP